MPGPLVVITGATRGIGHALASKFSQAGHALLLVSRHAAPDGDFPDCLHAVADVADYKAMSLAIQRAEEAYGPVECLVNNAGFLKVAPLQARDAGEMSYEVDVLLKGVLYGVRLVLPGMIERKRGTIINISSIGDRTPGPDGEVYHACKAAVRSLSLTLHKSQAPHNVRVVNVAPGLVKTDIHEEMGISFEEYSKLLGNPTFIEAAELADIIFYCWHLPQRICVRDLVVMPTDCAFG
ncbi:SDR family oxidoreductase [Bradyrhizobium sp. LHD-71]|uniref:SDR family oxidoreductase n=1 Tax=Bradyrhizobium sp. LHD-71 TaxID=3072141 RepID=UPI00280E14AB|nr:SDR family oxidoreductase [Bradyrhizobium sp. LHD-71]MDQ8729514.1 SDR family oxidoreductase [Bradyrhizobium sp. LHD-71]